MDKIKHLAKEHSNVTRRYFLQLGTAGVTAMSISELWAGEHEGQIDPLLTEAISKLEYLTQDKDFRNFGRGKPPPHKLPPEKLREVGLTRDTWELEVVADPESNAEVERPLSRASGTAMNWA